MARYRFLTTWLLDCPREAAWEAIFDQRAWPQWWRGVEEVVEIDAGREDGVGSHSRMTWRSFLPYDVVFEVRTRRVERPHLIEADATGDLAGVGRWRLFEEGGATAVLYEWDVATGKRWMNLGAPLLRPVFAWNHNWVMARGGEGIARRLGCTLLAP